MSRRRRWSEVYDALWFEPALAIAGALILGFILSNIAVAPGSRLERVVFKGSVSDGRQLLAVVTGTMITVTSLVFALTVVTLQIAGTQFSPRLLRSLLRDRGTQMVLSTFVGTGSYSLAGLHTVGSNIGGVPVPRLAVSGALVLALVSVGMLVYYVATSPTPSASTSSCAAWSSAPATCCAGTTNRSTSPRAIPAPRTTHPSPMARSRFPRRRKAISKVSKAAC